MPISPISQSQSKILSNIAAICALLVVAIHVPVDISRCGEGSAFGIWLLLFHEGFARAAVPMFFFVSGYLLAGHFGDKGWYRVAICKRIRTLLIPYITLNMAFLLCVILGKAIKAPADAYATIRDWRYIVEALGLVPWEHPINFVLWYLRCLLYFVLLSPIIKIIIGNKKFAFAAGGCMFCSAGIGLSFLMQGNGVLSNVNWSTNFDIYGLAVFTLGCAARLHSYRLSIINKVRLLKAVAGLFGVLAIYAICASLSNPPRSVLILVKSMFIIPVCMLAIYKLATIFNIPSIIRRNTMPLFGFQIIILFVAGIVASMYGKSILAQTIPMYITIWGCVIAMCIVGGVIFRKLLPKVAAIIFGGR